MSPSGVGEAEPPLRCPHKDGVVDMRFLTHLPAGSGLGGPPLKVRDLSLPLIGAEDTPLTPNGGDTSAKLVVRKIQKGGYVDMAELLRAGSRRLTTPEWSGHS